MPVIINGTTGVTFPNGVTMSDGTSAPVTVAQGGTGANTAANARTSLGLAIGTDVLAPNGSGANLTSLNASAISAGTLASARLPSSGVNAASITTGTLAVAQGGTGTATPSLVAGSNISISGTWPNQTVTGTTGAPTTAQVLTATAGLTAGAVGTYAYVRQSSGSSRVLGEAFSGGEYAGWSSGSADIQTNNSISGTWRVMGFMPGGGASVAVRIS